MKPLPQVQADNRQVIARTEALLRDVVPFVFEGKLIDSKPAIAEIVREIDTRKRAETFMFACIERNGQAWTIWTVGYAIGFLPIEHCVPKYRIFNLRHPLVQDGELTINRLLDIGSNLGNDGAREMAKKELEESAYIQVMQDYNLVEQAAQKDVKTKQQNTTPTNKTKSQKRPNKSKK